MSELISKICLSRKRKQEFEYIQWRAWEVAKELNPLAINYGFNINSTFQSELYTEFSVSEAGDLTWKNFIELFPEYLTFCNKYNFYPGCTMISRNISKAHRHGTGQYTLTYPLRQCDNINVLMITPVDVIAEDTYELNDKDLYKIDFQHTCQTGDPFLLKANHFHMTTGKEFVNGQSIFTVWHNLSTFDNTDISKLNELLNDE